MSHHHYLSLGLLVILSACFAISLGEHTAFNTEESKMEAEARPPSWEVDQAGKMLNGTKGAYKKMQRNFNKLAVSRRKRSHTLDNGRSLVNPEVANITGGKHMLDLFRNLLTSPTEHEHSQTDTRANTIKSLTFAKRYSIAPCEFSFKLAAVKSSEFILQSKLWLYLQLLHPVSTTYFVDIKIKHSNGLLSDLSVMKEIAPSEDGYIEFEVAELVRPLNTGETHVVFKVIIYKTIQNMETSTPLSCGRELKFVNTDINETAIPILVINSYNSRMENIDYHKVTERVNLRVSASQPDENTDPNATRERRKRQAGIGGCGVKTLTVLGSEIAPDLLGIDSIGSVFYPLSYNAGICGGRCVSNLPGGASSKHAPFIHVLMNTQSFRNRQGLSFSQCCVPVKYKPLDVLLSGDGGIFILIIQDMIIDTCECIDIAI